MAKDSKAKEKNGGLGVSWFLSSVCTGCSQKNYGHLNYSASLALMGRRILHLFLYASPLRHFLIFESLKANDGDIR